MRLSGQLNQCHQLLSQTLDKSVLLVYAVCMAQDIETIAAQKDNLSTRLPETLNQFVDEVARVRRTNRSQAARLLIGVVYEKVAELPANQRATAIKQLG